MGRTKAKEMCSEILDFRIVCCEELYCIDVAVAFEQLLEYDLTSMFMRRNGENVL